MEEYSFNLLGETLSYCNLIVISNIIYQQSQIAEQMIAFYEERAKNNNILLCHENFKIREKRKNESIN